MYEVFLVEPLESDILRYFSTNSTSITFHLNSHFFTGQTESSIKLHVTPAELFQMKSRCVYSNMLVCVCCSSSSDCQRMVQQ